MKFEWAKWPNVNEELILSRNNFWSVFLEPIYLPKKKWKSLEVKRWICIVQCLSPWATTLNFQLESWICESVMWCIVYFIEIFFLTWPSSGGGLHHHRLDKNISYALRLVMNKRPIRSNSVRPPAGKLNCHVCLKKNWMNRKHIPAPQRIWYRQDVEGKQQWMDAMQKKIKSNEMNWRISA